MPLFAVSWHSDIDAPDEETAAIEAARELLTTRPQEFRVRAERGKTILVRVDRGEGKRL